MKKILIGAVILLVIAFGWLFYRHTEVVLEMGVASQHVQMILEAEQKEINGADGDAIDQLSFIRDYYPSGSRLRKDGRMDRMLEAVRANSMEHIRRIRPDAFAAWQKSNN